MEKSIFLSVLLILALSACTSKAPQVEEKSSQHVSEAQSRTDNAPEAATSFQNVDVEGFKKLMQQKDVVVLDVRTPQEVAQGVIPGAVNINLYDPDFEAKLDQLDKDKTYLVYCRSGHRSSIAAGKMLKKGFGKIYNLQGGYNAWSAAKGQ